MIGDKPSECHHLRPLLVISALLSWIVFFSMSAFGDGGGPLRGAGLHLVPLLRALSIDWALRVDTLTAVMLVVVTTGLGPGAHLFDRLHAPRSAPAALLRLSVAVHLCHADAGDRRQLSCRCSSAGRASGLASYLLIGFWYTRPSANAAAIKAFVVNRVGDFGFALGIFALFVLFGSIDLDTVFANAESAWPAQTVSFLSWEVDALTTICLLLFMGAMGKSAQFLLHTWLPDAMEGPTPVSALIHAATMVTAGVFMVARLSPLFELSPTALDGRDGRRRDDGVLRRHRRSRAERHQAGDRLFDLLAARLHVRRARRRRLFRSASSTCSRTPSSRRCCSSAPARSSMPLSDEQDMRKHGRSAANTSRSPLDDADRHAGAHRLSVHFAGFFSKDAIIESAFVAP